MSDEDRLSIPRCCHSNRVTVHDHLSLGIFCPVYLPLTCSRSYCMFVTTMCFVPQHFNIKKNVCNKHKIVLKHCLSGDVCTVLCHKAVYTHLIQTFCKCFAALQHTFLVLDREQSFINKLHDHNKKENMLI